MINETTCPRPFDHGDVPRLQRELDAANARLAALSALCNDWECHDNTGAPEDIAVNELIEHFRAILDPKTDIAS